MSFQTKTSVKWDPTLVSLNTIEDNADTREAKIADLIQFGIKITTGAPVATAGHFIAGALIQNSFDGTLYENTGTTAAPVWTLVETSTGVEQTAIQFEDENGAALGTPGTVNEFEITGPSVTAIRAGNKVTYTISALAGPTPSPYSLGAASGYQSMGGTAVTLTNPQYFTTGNLGVTTLTGTPTFGTGSNLGTTGLAAGEAALLALHNTLKVLTGTDITGNAAAIEAYNGGYGAGVFTPGVYTTASALGMTAARTITLSGLGDYIFISTGGALVFGATDNIVLTNGAVASRVYWVINNDITTGSTDNLKGNFLSGGDITIGSTNNIEGRLLALHAITIDGTATNLYKPLA